MVRISGKNVVRFFGTHNLPDHLKADFEWIKAQLLARPPLVAQERINIVSGSLDQTLHSMRKKTGIKIAERIVYVRDKLHEYNNDNAVSAGSA